MSNTKFPRPDELIQLPINLVQATSDRILQQWGTPPEIATQVTEALISSELEGYASHGLLRLPEYVGAIGEGTLKPKTSPSVQHHSNFSRTVDGERGFGILAANRVQEELSDLLAKEEIATVGLRNSNHIGRLAHLVYPLSLQGYLIIGFANYLGAGQKVPPWGGTEGRFCTNPIVFGIPTAAGEPIIVDLTTSAVSEGKIRAAAIEDKQIPEGWLIDSNWKAVTDPKRLYADPPTAYLAPLGGIAGYKGFALALVTEILSGIITGAGYSQPTPARGGNGGLFIGFHLTLFGQSRQKVLSGIDNLIAYIQECPVATGFESIEMPGQGSQKAAQARRCTNEIEVSQRVWKQIIDLQT